MGLKARIGKNISYLCTIKNIDRQTLSERTGKGPATITGYVKGRILTPTDVVVEFAELFEVSLDDFLLKDMAVTGYTKNYSLEDKVNELAKTLEDVQAQLRKEK